MTGLKNSQLYPIYGILSAGHAWTPVFFLFFNELVSLQEVLWLEAFYYFCVVSLEVPSGYFSDRIGRKITLLIASSSFIGGALAAYFAADIYGLALGQLLFALGFAFYSGTNHALFYDSLVDEKKEAEFSPLLARVESRAFGFSALCALIGGVAGSFAYRNAYLATAVIHIFALLVLLFIREPQSERRALVKSFSSQLKSCFNYLKNPQLQWVFAFTVILTVLIHIPYMFYQPYINLLDFQFFRASNDTALLTGTLRGTGTLMAGIAVAYSVGLMKRFGTLKLLLGVIALETLVISGMALTLHPLIILLILFRTLPTGLSEIPVQGLVNPLIPAEIRATYLSLKSFVGRISFSLILLLLAALVGDTHSPDWRQLQTLLSVSAGLAALSFIFLFWRRQQLAHGPA